MDNTRVEAIFNMALQKRSPDERNAYLDGACERDAELRSRVETLLKAHHEAGGFLELTSASDTGVAEEPGSSIGRYKLLQRIGEGGFGVVYMAEQLEPVRRKVALKIIKLGMDTRQVVARFESERQALALMDHPNIARVLDAGATDSGRPYFVMELVRGIPVTDYCDQNHLTTPERLELFISICHAVQHAHHKGIIHRDIKPSNVLVTLHDGEPVPKVIDFGIAKATNQRLTEKTLFTEFRQFIGTPQYMSPEQAEMSGLDVDTRSDIYSLGVLLYELLIGSPPFDAETLRRGGYGEMQRIIREVDPPSPSMRLSTMQDAATVASNRRAEVESLSKMFRGDLDWIVMKALEKDRTRRYETAKDLASDIERFLVHEPVTASPPSTTYRLRKFIRRNRVSVIATALVCGALLLGLTASTFGLFQAYQQAKRANVEATRSADIATFLQEMLVGTIDPDEAAHRNINVQEVLARAKELFGEDHATVAATLGSLALQLQHSGNLVDAEPLYRESLRLWRATYGDNHANVGMAWNRLGSMLQEKGDEAAAEPALREAIRILDRIPGSNKLAACDARRTLATILDHNGKSDEAEALLRESIKLRRASPADQQWQIAATLEQLAGVLMRMNRPDELEATMQEMLDAFRPLMSNDSPQWALLNVGYALRLRQGGKNEQAEPYLRDAIRIYRKMENPPRDYYLIALDGLFQLVVTRDTSMEETIEIFHECYENMTYLYGSNHQLLAAQLLGFAKLLEQRRRDAEAAQLLIDGIQMQRAGDPKWDDDHWLKMLSQICRRIVMTAGLPPEAYQSAMNGISLLIADQPDHRDHQILLGIVHLRLGQLDLALQQLTTTDADQNTSALQLHRRAFLVLTHARLGDHQAAHETFAELQALQQTEGGEKTTDFDSAFAEAEAAVKQLGSPAAATLGP